MQFKTPTSEAAGKMDYMSMHDVSTSSLTAMILYLNCHLERRNSECRSWIMIMHQGVLLLQQQQQQQPYIVLVVKFRMN